MTTFGTIFAVYYDLHRIYLVPTETIEIFMCRSFTYCICVQGCLVVLLLQQWLVRHLTKRMMQLMTLEAFTEHRSKIPYSYLESYLSHQSHFSLSSLIERYLKGLASKWCACLCARVCMYVCEWSMCVCVHGCILLCACVHGASLRAHVCIYPVHVYRYSVHMKCCFLDSLGREVKYPTSKVLCFTRSSPLIHQLPAQYPCHAHERQSKDDIRQTLKVQYISSI